MIYVMNADAQYTRMMRNTTDPVTRDVHVIPVSTIRDLAHGRIELDDFDRPNSAMRGMIYMLVDMIDDEIGAGK